jgi:hypothetical protein
MAKMTIKQRLALARARHGHRVRRAGAFTVAGLKNMALPAGAGAAAHFAGYYAGDKLSFIGTNWYGEPLLLAVLAIVLKRRPEVSHALAGAAGYAAAFNYRLQQYQTGKTSTPPFHQFTGSGQTTRALPAAGEVGALMNPAEFATYG